MGSVEIRVGGQVVRPRTRDAVNLLSILAANHDQELTREWLAEHLWPSVDARVGSHNLRRALWDLRRTLGCAAERILVAVPSRNLRLDVSDAEIDIVQFDRAMRGGEVDVLRELVSTEVIPFAEGCNDAWAAAEREKRRQALVEALDALATQAGDTGRLDTAMHYRRQAARIAPLDRPAVRGSNPLPGSADVEAYQSFQRSLQDETPAPEPAPPSGARPAGPVRRDPAEVIANAPALPRRRPLPEPPSALIGRDKDVARTLKALGAHRLVTLAGPGGVGKTRLALSVAQALQEQLHEGAVFVELGALTVPDLVASTIAYQIAIPVDAGRSAQETLTRALASAQMLVVLDNCDGVREETGRIAILLTEQCPSLRVLATCRKVLQVEGETIHAVAPLAVPAADTHDAAKIAESSAVELFAARAGDAFDITDETADAAAAICRRLGGIPLAIELAAALVPTTALSELAAALEIELGRPTFGAVSGMARDRVGRAMLEFTYNLLPADEQKLLREVAVFAGGWTDEAARVVCPVGVEVDETDAELASLATRSLIVRNAATGRWDMSDTVRGAMLDRLTQSGDADAVRARHHQYFHDYCGRRDILGDLQTEVDNLRAALDWCLEGSGRGRTGIAICSIFANIVFERDVYAEVRARLTALLARQELQKPSSERVAGLHMLAYFALKQGDVSIAVELVRESVTMAERIRDRAWQRTALRLLGEAEDLAGDLTGARLALEKSVSMARTAHDTGCLSESLRMLGAVWEKIGNLDQAEVHLQEALSLMEPADHGFWPLVLCNLGSVAFRRGEYAEARACARRMLETRRAEGSHAHTEDCLELMARLAVAEGHFYRAARLYGAMMRIVESVAATKYWSKRLDFVARIRAVQHILGEDAYAKGYGEGQQMSWSEAVAFALDERPGNH